MLLTYGVGEESWESLGTARSNQSILKKINPEYSLEGLMLRLKLQYFGHLMQRADSLEKTLMLGRIEGGREGDDRGWDGWKASPTQPTWVWVALGDRKGQGSLAGCSPWGHNTDTTEQLNNNEMVVGKKDREREVHFWFVLRTIVPHSLVTHCGNT